MQLHVGARDSLEHVASPPTRNVAAPFRTMFYSKSIGYSYLEYDLQQLGNTQRISTNREVIGSPMELAINKLPGRCVQHTLSAR
jgi:hypothetical protein